MAEIHALAFPPGERWGPDALALQLGLPGAFGLLAGSCGFVLARVAADEAEILTLAVIPAHRRTGLATKLLSAARELAWKRGARVMFLEVRETNEAARALYAATGFSQVGRRRGYYRPGVDALVLRAALSTPEP
jgi:ribosomal-protein-alanine N-acetyltransferase